MAKPAKRRVKVWCDHIFENPFIEGLFMIKTKTKGGLIPFWIGDDWKACPICLKERPPILKQRFKAFLDRARKSKGYQDELKSEPKSSRPSSGKGKG